MHRKIAYSVSSFYICMWRGKNWNANVKHIEINYMPLVFVSSFCIFQHFFFPFFFIYSRIIHLKLNWLLFVVMRFSLVFSLHIMYMCICICICDSFFGFLYSFFAFHLIIIYELSMKFNIHFNVTQTFYLNWCDRKFYLLCFIYVFFFFIHIQLYVLLLCLKTFESKRNKARILQRNRKNEKRKIIQIFERNDFWREKKN